MVASGGASPATVANQSAVTSAAAAAPSIARRMPPSATSTGSRIEPIVPPSGTASCRQPSAMPRFSGGNSRKSDVMPATGTAAPPTPPTKSAAPNGSASWANPARPVPVALTMPPAIRMRRAPKRSTSIPAGTSAAADPRPTAA